MDTPGYDLIGDIHGEAAALRDLLARLGYQPHRGCWRHPSRRIIYLGDYIDRGPAIRETLQVVRAMVERGAAQALCGNHELNILLHDTPNGRGGWLCPHGGSHTRMCARTHEEFAARPGEWREWLRWFGTLPLWLNLGGCRAVHACWDADAVKTLGDRRLGDALLREIAEAQSPAALAALQLLKGPEIPVPTGARVLDRCGQPLQTLRVAWWLDGRGRTYREICLNRHDLPPCIPIPRKHDPLLAAALPRDGVPVFFGHYWMPPAKPAPLAPAIACLDYSVASGGPLVAYRWDGEQLLQAEKFVYDPGRLPPATAPEASRICAGSRRLSPARSAGAAE